MIASVASFKMHGQDKCDHMTFLVKSGLEVGSRIHEQDRPNRNSKLNRNHKIHLKHSYSLILLKSDFIHPTLTLLNRLSL